MQAYIEDTRRSIVTWLDKEFDILNLVLTEAGKYKEAALAKLQSISKEGKDISQMILVGIHPHGEQIKGRLEFLLFLSNASDMHLTPYMIDTLWNRFILQANTAAEAEIALEWFHQLVPGKNFDQKLGLYVFNDKICALDVPSFSTVAFKTFVRYFTAVNQNLGKVSAAGELLDMSGLTGLDALWKIALQVADRSVFYHALEFTIKLYQKPSADYKGNKNDLVQLFINTTMKHLTASFPSNPERLDRCITLLKVSSQFSLTSR
jgi:hypothetical protein